MDRGVEEPLAAALGALAVAGVLFDVGDHACIKNTLTIRSGRTFRTPLEPLDSILVIF